MAKQVTEKGLAIGRRLRARRGSMTIGALSGYSGVSRSYISQIENGQVPSPSGTKLQDLAKWLGCTALDLLEGPDEPAIDLEDPNLDLMFYNAKRVLTTEEKRQLAAQIELQLRLHHERYGQERRE